MRRLLLALPLLAAVLATACSDDHDAPVACTPMAAGATNLDASCKGPPPDSTIAVDAFRAHTIRASSATGGAARVADGVVNALADCMAQALASVIATTLSAELGTSGSALTVDCTNELESKGLATFASGTYTVHGQERGGKTFAIDSDATSQVRLYTTRAIGAFKSGDLVTVDVLLLDSYLVGAHVVVDAKGNGGIAYDHTGPLVEALGKGATPPNPLLLTDDIRTSLASAFALDGTVHSDLEDCGSEYQTVADHTISRTALNTDIKPVLVSAVTTGPKGQTITAKVWDTDYSPAAPGIPTGHVDADVAGIPGVAHARVDFDDPTGVNATLTLICQ